MKEFTKTTKYICDVCDQVLEVGEEYVQLKEKDGVICRPCYEMKMFPTEVYSRVVGYIRPVKQWNKGKQAEFGDRKEYNIKVHM